MLLGVEKGTNGSHPLARSFVAQYLPSAPCTFNAYLPKEVIKFLPFDVEPSSCWIYIQERCNSMQTMAKCIKWMVGEHINP